MSFCFFFFPERTYKKLKKKKKLKKWGGSSRPSRPACDGLALSLQYVAQTICSSLLPALENRGAEKEAHDWHKEWQCAYTSLFLNPSDFKFINDPLKWRTCNYDQIDQILLPFLRKRQKNWQLDQTKREENVIIERNDSDKSEFSI